jgi:hypothetical protein
MEFGLDVSTMPGEKQKDCGICHRLTRMSVTSIVATRLHKQILASICDQSSLRGVARSMLESRDFLCGSEMSDHGFVARLEICVIFRILSRRRQNVCLVGSTVLISSWNINGSRGS